MKIILLILKIILIPLTLIFTFFNLIAGAALINGNSLRLGIEFIALTVIGYDIATVLVWCRKEITAGILSIAGSITLLLIKNDFLSLKLIGNNNLQLYNARHLPSISITGIILIFAIIKTIKTIKDARRKKALKNREKAPSIFS